MDRLMITWTVLAVIFAVLEAITVQIVTIWFAVGAVGAIIANASGASQTVQLVIFVAVSLLTLLIARPFLKKFTRTKVQPTNLDMCIGKEALVVNEIDNIKGTGQVKIMGSIWTARSSNDEVIPSDSLVTVESINGVKLIVTKK